MLQNVLHSVKNLVVALVLVLLLVAASAYGFAWQAEGDLVGICARLCNGSLPFVTESSPLQVVAWMCTPLYALLYKATGSADGMVYLFRIVYLVFAAFVAIALHHALNEEFGSVPAAAVGIGFLCFVGLLQPGITIGNLCAIFMAIMFLAGWNSWRSIMADDGSASAGRVVHPLIAGACFVLAFVSDPRMLPALVIVCAVGYVLAWRSELGNPLDGLLWSIVGAFVAGFIMLFGFVHSYDPTLLASGLGGWIASLPQLPLDYTPLLLVYMAVVLLMSIWLDSKTESPVWSIVSLCLVAVVSAGLACVHMIPVVKDSGKTALTSGIASGLTVNKQTAEDYTSLAQLATTANGETSWVCATGTWSVTSGTAGLTMMGSKWVLVPSQELLAREANKAAAEEAASCQARLEDSVAFDVMLENETGTVYKRTTEASSIS